MFQRPKGEQRIAQAAFATLRRARSLQPVHRPSSGRDVGFAESGLEAWEGLRKENRPESTPSPPCGRFSASAFGKDCLTRAADFRALFSRDDLRQKRLDGISETTNLFWYKGFGPGLFCSRPWGDGEMSKLHATAKA